MKPKLFNRLFALTLAANTTAAMLANASEAGGVFAVLQGDSFFVPYGNYPHRQGMQLFDRAAAEEMAQNHRGALAAVKKFLTGSGQRYPVYIGHPDLPGSTDTDKRAYGWIEDVIPEETGARFPVKWSGPGRKLIANGHFIFYSPLWWTRKVTGGIRPTALKSMGLTNDPNIPVPALANEADPEPGETDAHETSETPDTETTEDIMNPEILAALGLTEGATPEEVMAAILALKQAAAEAEAKATESATAAGTAAEGRMDADEKCKTANEKITVLEGALQVAANHAVQAAVRAGCLTLAEAEAKVAEILAANDFQAALTGLAELAPKVKTASVTGDLGAAKARLVVTANDSTTAARELRATLVENEFQAINPALSHGARKRLAWQRAQAKNPEAFGKTKNSTGADA